MRGRPPSRPGGSRPRSAATAATRPGCRSTPTPRDAVTDFELVEALPGRSLLRVTLETGRTHQIRVHLAAIGHPVVGDPVYGHGPELGLDRQFLHAAELRVRAPHDRRADRGLGAAPGRSRSRPPAGPNRVGATIPAVSDHPLPGGEAARRRCPARAGLRSAPPDVQPQPIRRSARVRSHDARAARGRRPLRPPDPTLEPQDAPVHLRRARRHLHHRSAADDGASARRPAVRVEHRRAQRHRALRRDEEAVPGRRRRARPPRRDALREPPLAGRPAHQLPHHPGADRRPARAAPAEDRGPARSAAPEGAPVDALRAREARGQPGRRRRHAQAARRGRRDRHEEGGARRARGAAPEHPGDRARRHELRPRRRRLRHPRKRRRHPLVGADRARARRRRRRGPEPRREGVRLRVGERRRGRGRDCRGRGAGRGRRRRGRRACGRGRGRAPARLPRRRPRRRRPASEAQDE